MPIGADFVVSLQPLHAWQKRLSLPALTGSLLLMVLGLLLLGTTGCGGPGVVPEPAPGPKITKGNIFTPVPLPLSPNSAGEINDAKALSASLKKANRPNSFVKAAGLASPAGSPPAPTINSWFYLVNGSNTTTPNVLTVNGAAPNGATNPNGGTGVGVAARATTLSPFQLWKAVSWNNNLILRSAQSFETSQSFPSPLDGYGGGLAYLDLGYNSLTSSLTTNSSQPVGIFWEATGSPTGDQSAFQQWTYNSYGMLQNMNTGLYIWDDNNTAAMGASSGPFPDPQNTWYAYPDYYMNRVVNQANCDPPYPAWAPNATATPCTPVNTGSDAAGEQAAYNYFSEWILNGEQVATESSPPALPTCTYDNENPNTQVSGIRCAYDLVYPTGGPLITCISLANSPGYAESQYSGTTPISAADWTAVANQLGLECQYANEVQGVYTNFTNIIDAVFIENNAEVLSLANDVGVPTSTPISTVPAQIIEGVMYTALSAMGTAGGVLANVMNTAFNAVQAEPNQTLTHPLAATVGSIYGELAPAFQSLEDQTANGENTILEDWGRLSLIGPRANIQGYNGLALSTQEIRSLEIEAGNGYNLMFLSQLIPSRYCMGVSLARDPINSDYQSEMSSLQSYNQWSYPTFGSLQPANTNIGWFYETIGGYGNGTGVPPSQAVTNDLNQAGALSYEYENAINLWKSECFADQGRGTR